MPLGNDLVIGEEPGSGKPILFTAESRQYHAYVVGATRTGKTRFLANMICQDVQKWRDNENGVLLLDPTGELFDMVMNYVVEYDLERSRPIIPIDFRERDFVVGYNPLRKQDGVSGDVIIRSVTESLAQTTGARDTSQSPRLRRWMDNALTVCYENGITLPEAYRLLDQSQAGLRTKLAEQLSESLARRDMLTLFGMHNAVQIESLVESSLNRLHDINKCEALRLMFGQQNHSLDLAKAMKEGQIILVALSTKGGNLDDSHCRTFGTLLLSDLWRTAQRSIGKKDSKDVRPFYCYLDEFQNFITPTISKGVNEASGYGLHFTFAHQYPSQLLDEEALGESAYRAVLNIRNKFCFQMSFFKDLEMMAQQLFMSEFDPDEIKDEIRSPQVVAQRIEYHRSYGETMSEADVETWSRTKTESESSSRTSGSTESSGSGYGNSEGESGRDGDVNPVKNEGMNYSGFSSESDSSSETDQRGTSASEQAGGSRSRGRSKSETYHPMQVSQIEERVTSRTFRPLNEQVWRSMAILNDQQQRQGVARIADRPGVTPFSTPYFDAHAPEKYMQKARLLLLEKSQCALPYADAQKVVEGATAELLLLNEPAKRERSREPHNKRPARKKPRKTEE